MTTEELLKQSIEKLNQCAFHFGSYAGVLFQILSDIPGEREFDSLESKLRKLLTMMNKDIEKLFYGDKENE